MFALVSLALILCSGSVAAHGGVVSYAIEGNWYWGWKPNMSGVGQTGIQRPWATDHPITDATASTLACNNDGTSGPLQLTATVKAGSAITAYWSPWPHPTGPVLTYLAQCPGSTCTGVNANTLKWFKIDQAGLINGTVASGTWAAELMISQNNSWTSTIPSSVPTGNYLIRFETIALHSLPAQIYPECAQLSITDGGSLAPTAEELVTFPGAYSNSELGLTLSLYSNVANFMDYYPIPGPPLYAGAKVTVPSLPNGPPPSVCSPTPSGPGTVPQYGQCGGQGWTGGTVCMAPYVCTYYYAQCL